MDLEACHRSLNINVQGEGFWKTLGNYFINTSIGVAVNKCHTPTRNPGTQCLINFKEVKKFSIFK